MAAWSKSSKSSLSLRVASVELRISMPSLDLVVIVAKVGGWWLACSLAPRGCFVADWRPTSVFCHDLGIYGTTPDVDDNIISTSKAGALLLDSPRHTDRKSTRLNSSHITRSRVPSSA